ncbi:16S rRNA (Guanine(966)-N(2))-methyltransferase RsmD [Candidatus Defluviicoccus seviourii]|uniref:16S rRNA (Guanine(966)-N(2))-methyltransferase RsmD n=1 Tax=Candidatus Defluviicoccus seviourii TaxID=2565273 RepID=A0A564WFH9_9PROT|nr:16S rRNA (Guanine(966)-N(2))-methyltransferase RsmD [Candidatus Defluviicoccus seviourii]
MRIIAGKHRGRRIVPPASLPLRPTLERVRQSVFDILAHGVGWAGFADAAVLDVFAGSGAYGLEALSRGARHACFIDIDAQGLKAIERNAAVIGESRSVTFLQLDAARLPSPPATAGTPAALAFLDPPYGASLAVPALTGLARGWLAPDALAVVEVATAEPFAAPPPFRIVDERTVGPARIVFCRLDGGTATSRA